MSGAQSISTRRAYGVQRVCRVWHCARSSVWVANYYSAPQSVEIISFVILGVVARMFRCATRSSCWCT